MKRVHLIHAALVLATSAIAQTTPAPAKNPVTGALRDILTVRETNTLAAIEAMPADKFNYKLRADVMTVGQLVAHMVETNICCAGRRRASPLPQRKR